MRTQLVYTILAAGVAAITVSYLSYYIIRRKRQQKPPKNAKWQLVGTVEEIALYPVTSGAALLLKNAKCEKLGLVTQDIRDRSFIAFDENGKSACADAYPQMLGINMEILDKKILVLRAPNMELLTLDMQLILSKPEIVKQKKGFKSHLVECEAEHHKWFNKVISDTTQSFKLYICKTNELEFNLLGEDKSDLIPVMVMNKKSVEHLNQLLQDKNHVHHLQFRGNLLINPESNIKPYEEDNWYWLKIGDDNDIAKACILRYQGPCLRCILPNIDVNTFKRNPDFEPLKTLNRCRRIHNSKEPTMGAYYKIYQEGVLKLNDPVYALYYK